MSSDIFTSTYNPDVLSCLANLSSDEVFTPPNIVNQMLDLLPKYLWHDKNITFFDPASKSGIFLREIAKRLLEGLKEEIPDLQERIDHIFQKQLFGIAITELTSLLSRRSLYCSKYPNREYSITQFDDADGNIRFKRILHKWENGRCLFCGASKGQYDRGEGFESHAYEFIHTKKPEEIFNMKFDVIIGNPPYHLSDQGYGRSASPIYHEFVNQAKKLQPKFLTMILPSRWFAGGKGLNTFREEMLNDDQTRTIVDYIDASEIFPGVDIAGGICYFLWEKDSSGPCEIINIYRDEVIRSIRPLNEFSTLIRHGSAISIIRKVLSKKETCMNNQVSSRKPFGLPTNAKTLKNGDIILRTSKGEGYYLRKSIRVGIEFIDKWKVITSKVSYDHAGQPDKDGMRKVLSIVDILPPGTICTETYLLAGRYDTKLEAERLMTYLKTKFVRFLVSQLSFSQDITKDRFSFVPILPMDKEWTDEILYKRYVLTSDEIAFIESTIRPMETNNRENNA